MILGEGEKTPVEYFSSLHLSQPLAIKAAEIASKKHLNPLVFDKEGTQYHELTHVFNPAPEPQQLRKMSLHKSLYENHKAEVTANAFENLKLLQRTGNLELTRLNCDLDMLFAFYAAGSSIKSADGEIGARRVAYFSHSLYDNLRKAYEASPDYFKDTTDKQLMDLARDIGKASIYTPQVFAEIDDSLVTAHRKLRPDTASKGDDGSTLFMDEGKDPDTPLVEKSLSLNLLSRSQPYVVALQQAEARVLGLQRHINR